MISRQRLHQFRAIIFDMDGVLLRSMPIHWSAWQRAGQSLGVPMDRDDIYAREGESGRVTARALAPAHLQRHLIQRKEDYFLAMQHRVQPYAGVEQLLRWLQHRQIRLGLVTGTARAEMVSALPLGLAQRFHTRVAGDEVRQGKPHPEGYRRACRFLRVAPRTALVVENAPYGLRAARCAGIGTIVALATTVSRRALHEADHVLSSIRHLHRWLQAPLALLLLCCVCVLGCATGREHTRIWQQPYHAMTPTTYMEPATALDDAPAITTPVAAPRTTLRVGEKLTYDARWMGIPVGYGTVEVQERTTLDGRPVFHVVGEAHSNAWLSKFYPLHDVVHSYIDAEQLHTLKYEKSQREGKYRAEEVVTFDHARGVATYESLLNRAVKERLGEAVKEVPIPAGAHDPVSMFYQLRLRDLTVGESEFVDVYSDEKSYHMEVKILKSMRLELRRRGVFDTIKVEPLATFKGLLVDRGRVVMYLTADERRVPLAVYIWTPWGLVSGIIDRKTAQDLQSQPP